MSGAVFNPGCSGGKDQIMGGSGNTVPRLETARTVMRGHRLDDFEASAKMWADLEVVRKISGRPSSREDSWYRMLRHVGHWQLLGFGYWLVEDRETGEFLGEVGFADHRREMDPPLGDYPEIGWVMCVAAQGRGLASEAVAAAVAWADDRLANPKTVCFMLPDHETSIRIAEKNGYRRSGPARYRDAEVLVMGRPVTPHEQVEGKGTGQNVVFVKLRRADHAAAPVFDAQCLPVQALEQQ